MSKYSKFLSFLWPFSIVKSINAEEKEKLSKVYKKLVKTEVNLIELDIQFSEEKEAKFVKESYETWQGIKKDILSFIDVVNKNWDNKIKVNGKDYFG